MATKVDESETANAGQPSTGAATATLRNSCDTCAASKIRCTKEKPECSRCMKRGLPCSYSIPRRPGRPAQNRPGSSKSGNPKSRPGSVSLARTARPDHHMNGDRNDFRTSPSLSSGNASPIWPNSSTTSFTATANPQPWMMNAAAPTPAEMDMLFNLQDTFNDNDYMQMDFDPESFDDLIRDFQPSAMIDSPDMSAVIPPLSLDTQYSPEASRLPTPRDSILNRPSSFITGSAPHTPGDFATSLNTFIDADAVTAKAEVAVPCSCQALAIGLTSQPTPSQSSNGKSRRPSFESVLDSNHTATDTIAKILKCHCRKDTYLLILLVMAMYKTLEWFDAAASVDKASGMILPPDVGIDGQQVNGQDAGRTAALVVLSKLPSVHKIVDVLSGQLRKEAENHRTKGGGDEQQEQAFRHHPPQAINIPSQLPPDMMGNFEQDLRRRTGKLARDMIARLR